MVRIAPFLALLSALSLTSAQEYVKWRAYLNRGGVEAQPSSSSSTPVVVSSTSTTPSAPGTSATTSISTGTFTPPSASSVTFPSSTTLPSATSTSSTQRAGSTGNCPSVRSTIFTTYATVFSQTGTSTSTYTSTSWDATVTNAIPTVTTVYNTTVTSTVSFTVVPIVVLPAQSTVTVPTPAGFTPVLCDEAYFNPTTTITLTSPVPNIAYVTTYISRAGTSTVIRSTVTGTTIASTPFTVTTSAGVTSTSTRASSTSTVYAACATDNITPFLPSRDFVGSASPQEDTARGLTSLVDVPAVDATDCCALCQANTQCAGSAYDVSAVNSCGHFIKQSNNATCDQSYRGVLAWNPFFTERFYISNGACGRYSFDTSAFWGCDPNTSRGC